MTEISVNFVRGLIQEERNSWDEEFSSKQDREKFLAAMLHLECMIMQKEGDDGG